MSTPVAEQVLTRTLLALWQKPETTVAELIREIGTAQEVQQAIDALRERRCLIEQTPTTLRLVTAGLPCWRDILEHHAARNNHRFGKRAIILARTSSTNDIAWQNTESADADGLLVTADEQTAGRGRFGHTWTAKPEQSVLCSLLLRVDPVATVDSLTLLAGLATARALEQLGISRAAIKWPNDILVNQKKLAGILVERRANHVVIGIGINISQTAADFPPEVAARATSVYQLTGIIADRLRVITALVDELEKTLAAPLPSHAWIDEWKSRCEMLNTRITVRHNGSPLAGTVLDIDPLQGLLLRDDHGVTHFLSAQSTTLSL